MKRIKTSLGLVTLLACGIASAALAQDGEGMGFSPDQSNRVASILNEGFSTCMAVPEVYRVDCFQQAYRSGAKILAHNAAYWEAEVALTRVGRTLIGFVRENADASVGRLRQGGFSMKAVSTASIPEARKIYHSSVTQAESILRSGGTAEIRYFSPIADVVGTHTSLSK